MRLATGLAAALLLASGSGRALELVLDPAGLDPPAQQRARDLLARARERLPGHWQADPRRLTLRFDPRLPADIAGRHRNCWRRRGGDRGSGLRRWRLGGRHRGHPPPQP